MMYGSCWYAMNFARSYGPREDALLQGENILAQHLLHAYLRNVVFAHPLIHFHWLESAGVWITSYLC